MIALMSDHDITGLAHALFRRCRDDYGEYLDDIGVRILTFETVGLETSAPDADVWNACQQNSAILVTANRNAESDDSLESTIQKCNQPDSLPVLTVSRTDRLRTDPEYFSRCAERLMNILFDLDQYRGIGRIYIP